MKRVLLFITTLLFVSRVDVLAQRAELSQFAFSLGYQNVNASRLNDFLPTAGANGFSNDNFSFGFLLQDTYGKGVIEFDFVGAGNNQNGTLYRTQLAYGQFLLKGGYTVVNGERFRLYPLVGIGFGAVNMAIANNNNITFGSLGNNPFQEINLTLPVFVLDLGLGGDYKVTTREASCGGSRHFMLGFRAGYFISPANNNWRYTGGGVNGAPSFGPQGFYARATIGFARSRAK
jgi:hypothetical protein